MDDGCYHQVWQNILFARKSSVPEVVIGCLDRTRKDQAYVINLSDFAHTLVGLCAISFSICLLATPASGQELLRNASFEEPVAPKAGNNIYATIPEWTISNQGNSDPKPHNIVRPTAALCCKNATQTPSGGGEQYYDVSGTSGQLNQAFKIGTAGMISFSGWFSVRDSQQSLSGMFVRLRDLSNDQIVGTAAVSFDASEPIGLWKQAHVDYLPVAAGSYQFEAFIPNPANFDLASVSFAPSVSLHKTSEAFWDPVSNYKNPKLIPGGYITYSVTVDVPKQYGLGENMFYITEATPPNLALVVADFEKSGSGPVELDAGSSDLSLRYGGLTSKDDGIEFSNNGGKDWSYQPEAGKDGTDWEVTHIRILPSGAMAPGSSATVRLRYVIR